MRFALALLAVPLLAQPTVSSVVTRSKTYSTITLGVQFSESVQQIRARWGLTTNYEAEGGCTFPDCGVQHPQPDDNYNTSFAVIRLGGFSADTALHLCVEGTANGTTWTASCPDHEETTAALPAGDHPAYPVSPDEVDTTRPDTSGYTVRAVASNCSDLQTKIDAAAADQLNNGSVITIPAGTTCSGMTLKAAPGVKSFSTANVNTSNNRITVSSHGWSNNDQVMVAAFVPPGSAGSTGFRQYRGFPYGSTYYAKVHDSNTISLMSEPSGAELPFTFTTFTADAGADTVTVPLEQHVPENNQTIQAVSTGTLPAGLAINTTYHVVNRNQTARTFQISASSGGAAIDITDAGSGTHSFADQGGGGSIQKWPPTSHQIIIRTATADSAFVPEGVRVAPDFASKMAKIGNSTVASAAAIPVQTDYHAHNYRIEGLEITHLDTATAEMAGGSTNPDYHYGLLRILRPTSNIVFDRCYIHGLGYPNRLRYGFFEFDGRNHAIINSYLSDLDYWIPARPNTFVLTRNSNTEATIPAGSIHMAPSGPLSQTVASPITITLTGGGVTGTGYVYYTTAGALTVLLPTGASANCSPTSCDSITSGSPAWPTSGGRGTVMPIGTLTFSAGNLTAATAWGFDSGMPFVDVPGGHTSRTGAVVSGIKIENNTISGSGLPIHFDDDDWEAPLAMDFTIRRNHFITPDSHSFSHPDSNHLWYAHRQQLEFKCGKEIRITGNIFEGTSSQATPVSTAIAIGTTVGRNCLISDLEISYNRFSGAGGWMVSGGRPVTATPATHPPGGILQRTWIHNNLQYGIDAYTWKGPAGSWVGYAAFADHRRPFEDLRLEHNTIYTGKGRFPGILFLGYGPHAGLRVADNNLWFDQGELTTNSRLIQFENCPSFYTCSGGKATLDVMSNGYQWTNNSIIAGWNQARDTPLTTTSLATEFPDGMSDLYTMAGAAGHLEYIDPSAADFRLKTNASHKSGGAKNASDGLDRGVDMDRLDREIGNIHAGDVLSISASGAVIPFRAPDRGAACTVLYGTGSDPAAWTGRSSPNTADDYARSVTLSGLSSATDYRFRVGCAGTAMTATKGFRTL